MAIGRIPENILEDILSRVDIVELISTYIPLKRAGRNFKATCPFHHEKTPSFMVSPDRQIYHCFGCFPAGSLIKTENGFHKIENLQANQMVLTHRGRYRPVTRTLWRPYAGELIEFYTRKSNLPVTVTEDHEIFTIKTKQCKYKSRKSRICQWRCRLNCPGKYFNEYKIQKLPARQLAINDYVLYPINQEISERKFIDLNKYYNRKISNFGPDIKSIPTKVVITEGFLKLIGYWIAEGSNHRAYIRFSLGNHEREFAEEIKRLTEDIFHIEASIHIRKNTSKTGLEVSACNSKLSNIFENLCGKGAENKHIPFELQNLSNKKQKIILEAIFKGDGFIKKMHKCKKNRRYKVVTTISLVLAEQIKDILLRLGFSPAISARRAKIDNKGTKHRTSYDILWEEDVKLHFSDIVRIDNILYQIVPIRKITKKNFCGDVYNLTVAEDHSYSTPNFVVGNCHAGGNAFKFLMEYERLEFIEAVEELAKKSGVALPEAKTQDSKTTGLILELYKVNELTALFYEQNLNSGGAGVARNYLLSRGIKEETKKMFKLGYSSEKWDALINHLRAKNINLSLLEKAGLVLAKENGGYYDRFRNRIIFPILDVKSRPLGFGARVLDNALPKYINSPETPIYTKGRNLYGLNLSRDAVREKDYVVVVEGYLDFIMPYQEGFKNIVASLGTALTYEQVRLLKRYTHNAVMIYDADTAGQLATLRTLDMFIEEGMSVKVVSLPQGYDPDSFVRNAGIDKFKEKVEQAQGLFDYKLKMLKERHNINEAEGKAKIASEMLTTIKKSKNAILRSEYIKRIAEALNIADCYIVEELNKIKPDLQQADSNQLTSKKTLSISPTEKLLIKLMLEETEFIGRVKESLEPADFQDKLASRIVSAIFDFLEQGKKIETNSLINYFGDEDISLVICESVFLEVPSNNKERVIDDCIQRLKNEKIKLKRQYLHSQIKEAQHLGDEQKLLDLMQEFQHLIKKRG